VLTDEVYDQEFMQRLIAATAGGGFTHVLVGGSTVARVTPAMLRVAFGERSHPFVLSFPGIRPADVTLIIDRLARSPTIERIIVTLDQSMLSDADAHRSGFPLRYYEPGWHDVLPDLDWMSLGDSVLVLYYGMLSRRARRGQDRVRQEKPPIIDRPAELAELKAMLAASRGRLLQPSRRTCADITSVADGLAPAIRKSARRGKAVDILLPPYSLAAYAHWYGLGRGLPGGSPETALADLLMLRRCMLTAVSGEPRVHVHGFDNDDSITADLRNYRDTTHIQKPEVYARILKAVAAGSNVLTAERLDGYERMMRERISAFDIPPPADHPR
jgi:hypothetical protein